MPTASKHRPGGSGRLEACLAALLLPGLGWALAVSLSAHADFVVDDAFIAFRFGRNLADGFGLRFNPADAVPTEGASSLLHVVLLAGARHLAIDPLLATRALGLPLFVGVPVVAGLALSRAAGAPRGVVILAFACVHLLVSLLPETQLHMASGMDTVLFASVHAFAFVWAARFALGPGGNGASSVLVGVLLLCALGVSRPEGPVLAAGYLAALAAAVLLRGDPRHREDLRQLAVVSVGAGAASLVFLAWKLHHFGHLLPNAYFVKSHSAIFGRAGASLPGLEPVASFLATRTLPLLAIAAGIAARLGGLRPLCPLAPLLLPSLGVTLLYARAIHETAFGHRYEYAQILPLTIAMGFLLARLWGIRRRSFAIAGIALLTVSSVPGCQTVESTIAGAGRPCLSATEWLRYDAAQRRDPHMRLGLDLAETGLGQDASILLGSAGVVPFVSGFYAIDWAGLNDDRLSGRTPLTLEQVWTYIDSFEPDVFASPLPPATAGASDRAQDPAFAAPVVRNLLAPGGSPLLRHWDRELAAELVYSQMRYIRDHYAFGASYRMRGGKRAMIAYVRRDSAHRDAIRETLARSRRASPGLGLVDSYVDDPEALGR